MKELKDFLMGFAHAARGIGYGIATQRNLRIHIVAACVVVIFGVMARLNATHWCTVILCCMVVIGLELLNTALEALCDKVSPKEHTLVRHCKDAAAGAVLLAAIGSVAVAVILLVSEPIYRVNIAYVMTIPRSKIGLVVDAAASLVFIFIPNGKRK